MNGRFLANRQIKERIVIRGTLALTSPTHLGGGNQEGVADMMLQRDEVSGDPLLTGASIAGALRSYLREYERGYNHSENPAAPGYTEQLFGYVSGGESPEAVLSWLMVEDARGSRPDKMEIRDGVTIDPLTRTAEKGKKFDIELLPAGTRFELTFELWVPEGEAGARLVDGLAIGLRGLAQGEIGLGARKRRGFGHCSVETWMITRWPMDQIEGVLAWLRQDETYQKQVGNDILALLGVNPDPSKDRRQQLTLRASFMIQDTLLIRSAGYGDNAPDAVHLHNHAGQPVIPGTSLAGVLRGRALRILNVLDPARATQRVNDLFGPKINTSSDQPKGSRIWVSESTIQGSQELVQSRVMIDRFTGGALPQHLFSEQPLIGGETEVRIQIQEPRDWEIGLLLLLLKDLWSGDLPIGGEASIGRGRLQGQRAELRVKGKLWNFSQQSDGSLAVDGDREKLEDFVQAIGQS